LFEFVTKRSVFDHFLNLGESPQEFGWLELQQGGLSGFLQRIEMSRVAEATGGKAFIHKVVDDTNELFVAQHDTSGRWGLMALDAFAEGAVGGSVDGQVNVLASCGQFDSVQNDELPARLSELGGVVAPRGIMVHTMAFYLEDAPSVYWKDRLRTLHAFADGAEWELLADIDAFEPRFSTRFATLSDADMFKLFRSSSVMKDLRVNAQGIVLLFAYRRVG
jgi:hypothetical protein